MRFRALVLIAGTLTVAVCLWIPVAGQGTSGSILGTIYDESKAVLPGVAVTAIDKENGQKRSAVTDDQGRYTMPQLKLGKYTVQAELPGFKTAAKDVTLTLEGDSVVNLTLGVGSAAATEITVTSEAPMVETTSATVRNLVDTQQIRDLPLNGRSFTDLATIQTGVVLDYNGARTQIGNEGVKISIAGARRTSTLFQLDGTDLRNQVGSTPGSLAGVLLGVDTVREFSVITNVADAEYGNFTGGVVSAVTKSGTNVFHGTVFEFLRNSSLDARNFFDRDPRNPLTRSAPPPFKRNQFGFTAGGPIVKDKLFFFTSFEGLHDRLSTTSTAQVPSLDARRGIIPNDTVCRTGCVVSPITAPILNAWPVPNSTIRPDGTADYVYTTRTVTDENYVVGKVDWQASDKDAFAVRYTIDHAIRSAPFNIDVVFDDSRTQSQYILLEWKRILSTKLINEAKVSLNRPFSGDNPDEHVPLPAVMQFNPLSFNFTGQVWHGTVVTSGVTSLGFNSVFGKQNAMNRFQYIDNLSYTTGAHSMKMGLNISRIHLNYNAPIFMPGQYTFNSIRDLITASTTVGNTTLPGTAFQFTGTLTGSTPRGMRETTYGFYFQDDWRVRSNLTANLGIRYEPYTPPDEVAGRLGNFRKPTDTAITVGNPLFAHNPSLKNFGPRVGVAWDPTGSGKTSFRVGYGLFFELVQPLHYFASPFSNPPYAIRVTQSNAPFPDITRAFPPGTSILISPWGFSDLINQQGTHQYQFSIQRQLSNDFVIQAVYMGSNSYNLGHMTDRNTALPQKDAAGFYPFFPALVPRRNPAFGQMRDFAWDGSASYNALGLTLKKRFTQGYSAQVSYTYGKNLDNTSAAGVGESDSQPNGLNTFTDDINLDRGHSIFDTRNRLSLTASWDLPFGAHRAFGNGWHGPVQQFLGGWTVNGILTAADGGWTSLRIPFNQSRSGQTADVPDRPSLVSGGNNNPVLSDGRDPEKYYDVNQFVLGPAGYFGTLGRNTLNVPGVLTMDLSVQKNFNFTEERYVQFRAEMFNLGNRANFASPGNSIFLNASGARNLAAGRSLATNTTARQIQFALKIYF